MHDTHETSRLPAPRQAYPQLVRRLSEQSVRKHFDAYADISWDDPGLQIEPDDPRWILADGDPLGDTAWYRALPRVTQARLGLHLVAAQMKIGVHFENTLSRGLLELASEEPNGSPAFRYAYHEVIEEGQHSLMFQELINRTGLDVPGVAPIERWASRRVARLGRTFPELFFLFVLGGEAPIDFVQRRALARPGAHPLLERIMRIHVLEEARHLCFAQSYLREHVPRLGAFRLLTLRLRTPLIFKAMSEQMLRPPREIIGAYGIPDEVVRAAYGSLAHRRAVCDGLAPVRALCIELGIITPLLVPLWRALGIWDDGVCGLLPASL